MMNFMAETFAVAELVLRIGNSVAVEIQGRDSKIET